MAKMTKDYSDGEILDVMADLVEAFIIGALAPTSKEKKMDPRELRDLLNTRYLDAKARLEGAVAGGMACGVQQMEGVDLMYSCKITAKPVEKGRLPC